MVPTTPMFINNRVRPIVSFHKRLHDFKAVVDSYKYMMDRLKELAATLIAVSAWMDVQLKTPYASGNMEQRRYRLVLNGWPFGITIFCNYVCTIVTDHSLR